MSPTPPSERLRVAFQTAWERADGAFPDRPDWHRAVTAVVGPEEVLRFYGRKAIPIDLKDVDWGRTCPLRCSRPADRRDRLTIRLSPPFPWACDCGPCGQRGEFLDLCDRLKPGSAMTAGIAAGRMDAIRHDVRALWSACQTTIGVWADPEAGPLWQARFDHALRAILRTRADDEGYRQAVSDHALKAVTNRLAVTAAAGLLPFTLDPDAFAEWLTHAVFRAVRTAAERRDVRPLSADTPAGVNLDLWADPATVEAWRTVGRYARLHACIAALPVEGRRIVRFLFFTPDTTQRQLARLLGVSDTTAWRRLHDALIRLARCLSDEGSYDP